MSGNLFVTEMNLEKALKEVFSSADEYAVGLVRSADLVSKLRPLVSHADVDLNSLQRLLDPKNDNVQIPVVEFLDISSKWFENEVLRLDPIQIDDPTSSCFLKYSHRNDNKWKVSNFMDCSGKVNKSVLAFNFIDSDQGPAEKKQVTDLVMEVKQLEDALTRISDEKMSVQEQLCLLEDSHSNLDTENKKLRSSLEAKEKSLGMSLSYQTKYEDLRKAMDGMEEESSLLKLSSCGMQQQLDVLTEENKQLQKELISSQRIASEIQENHDEAFIINEKQSQKLEKARSECESNKIELNKFKHKLRSLEEEIGDERAQNQLLKSELHCLKINLKQHDDNDNEEIELDKSFENSNWISAHNLKANDDRTSIGDEITQVFIRGDSPFCEKSRFSQISIEMQDQETQTVNELPKDAIDMENKKPVGNCFPRARFFKLDVPIRFSSVAVVTSLCLLLSVLFFTFFGAIEINNITLFPITWQPGYWLPEPQVAFKYQICERPI